MTEINIQDGVDVYPRNIILEQKKKVEDAFEVVETQTWELEDGTIFITYTTEEAKTFFGLYCVSGKQAGCVLQTRRILISKELLKQFEEL